MSHRPRILLEPLPLPLDLDVDEKVQGLVWRRPRGPGRGEVQQPRLTLLSTTPMRRFLFATLNLDCQRKGDLLVLLKPGRESKISRVALNHEPVRRSPRCPSAPRVHYR